MAFIGKQPKAGNFILLDSITTSATATYNLTRNSTAYFPASARNLIVSLNGVTQAPDTAYSVSGSTIVFASALTSNDSIDYILVLGDVLSIGTPADNTVGETQLSYPLTNFSSTGIDDNADATAITINSSENVGIGTTSPTKPLCVQHSSGAASEFEPGNAGGFNRFINFDRTASEYHPLQTEAELIRFATGTGSSVSERMRIDSSGDISIGSSSNHAGARLTINDTPPTAFGSPMLQVGQETFTASGYYSIGLGYTAGSYTEPPAEIAAVSTSSSGGTTADIVFGTRSVTTNTAVTERMRINSAGHVLIAKTALDNSTVGCRFNATGDASFVANGNRPLVLVRKSNSGDHLIFIKDSTTVGAIGDEGGDSLYIQSGDAGLRFSDGANAIFPAKENGAVRDNGTALGMTSARFDDAYIVNGVTTGSDEREKQDIAQLDEAEQRVAVAAKALLRKWRWKSAVEEKGDDARIHFGIIAQDLKAAFEAESLDAGRYGMFIHTTWTDEKTGEKRDRMGIRYSELLAFIIAAI